MTSTGAVERYVSSVTSARVVALILASAPAAVASAQVAADREVQHTVRGGDSLGKVAAQYGVTVDELRAWNPTRVGKADLIRIGDKLSVHLPPEMDNAPVVEEGPEWDGYYDIKSGDTLGTVARKLGVSVADLQHWNRLKPRSVIRAGAILKFKKRGPRPPARSLGRPTRGRVEGAEHLGPGHGYRLRFPKGAFGLPQVNQTIRRCAAEVTEKFPDTADILVGDISRPTGGSFPPHESHQSGRDADIGYYLEGNVQNSTMYRVGAGDVDHAKNWTLLSCLLEEGRVVRVYMDAGIQRAMSRYLIEQSLVSEELAGRLFEVRAPEGERALIKHAPLHDTHIHVRFGCPVDGEGCVEESADSLFKL